MAMEPTGWHWRDNMRPARFIVFDARAAMLVVLFLVHPRAYTITFIFLAFIFFYLLERFGLSFEASLRRFRAWLCGTERSGVIWTARRRSLDLGGSG